MQELEHYKEAIQKSRDEKKLTYKAIAKSASLREGDTTDVFKYLYDSTAPPPKPVQIRNVLNALRTKWQIVDGLLVQNETRAANDVKTKETSKQLNPAVITHPDFISAQIGKSIIKENKTVKVINTYLSNAMLNTETGVGDPETLSSWLTRGIKTQILILHPEKHAMRLRAKSLDQKGSDLANRLLNDLRLLLEFKRRFPDLLEVHLMDELPGAPAIITEKKVYWGLHLVNGHAETGPFFESRKEENPKLYEDLNRHFDTIWEKRSTPLSNDIISVSQNALYGVLNQLNYLKGNWDLFLHDVSDVLNKNNDAPFRSVLGNIERWEANIYEPDRGIYLRLKLGLPNGAQLEANLVTEHIGDRDYAHVRMSNFQNTSIHLHFYCRRENDNTPLLGFFKLSTGSGSCSGYMILAKNTGRLLDQSSLSWYFKRLLSFRDGSYQSLERVVHEKERFGDKFQFAGTYKVYSYGGKKGDKKGIKINWLHIDQAGITRYKNQRFERGDELTGRATYIAPNLYIMSNYFRENVLERRGYMIAKVSRNYPKTGRFYGAVNLGVSFERDQIPNGKRFILEYVEDIDFDSAQHDFIAIHSPEYKKLPRAIRGLLTGRIKNLNGFLRSDGLITDINDLESEWKASIKLDAVFYDSAVQCVRRGEYNDALIMLKRAAQHGCDDVEKFKHEVMQFDANGFEKMAKSPLYEQILNIINFNYPNEHSDGSGI